MKPLRLSLFSGIASVAILFLVLFATCDLAEGQRDIPLEALIGAIEVRDLAANRVVIVKRDHLETWRRWPRIGWRFECRQPNRGRFCRGGRGSYSSTCLDWPHPYSGHNSPWDSCPYPCHRCRYPYHVHRRRRHPWRGHSLRTHGRARVIERFPDPETFDRPPSRI